MSIKIAKMTLKDIETIAPILFDEFDTFWSSNILKKELESDNSFLFVAKYDDEIVGFASIWCVLEEAHLTNIVIKRAYRKRGFATEFLSYLFEFCKNSGMNTLTLEVNSHNQPAFLLYKKLGFTVVGKRPNYYSNNQDAILMTKNLN